MTGRISPPLIVVVGDVVLDRTVDGSSERLSPDAPVPVLDVDRTVETPGGAGLAALMCADSGADVTLVAPVADDPAGTRLRDLLAPSVRLVVCGHRGGTRRKTRLRSGGQPLVRVDDGGPGEPESVPIDAVREALVSADAVLVSDYGAGVSRHPGLRAELDRAARRVPVVWDPHPRGAPPVPGTAAATPNLAEAIAAVRALAPGAVVGAAPPDVIAARLAGLWASRAVCVTAGSSGAFLAVPGQDVHFAPAPAVPGGDPCGAGDRFASSVALALGAGALLTEAVSRAVADASSWVARGGLPAGGPVRSPDRRAATVASGVGDPDALRRLALEVRAGGRTLVATGGCFDIVHAGHVATLQAARRLGDALVVLINSDDSVRRLKGPGRPVVSQADRARVLAAFDCVDAVAVFDEDDPRRALDALRPDVWVKGGDYGGTPLPEADLVAANGGRTVFVPYLSGRSTTTILERSRSAGPASADPTDLESKETTWTA